MFKREGKDNSNNNNKTENSLALVASFEFNYFNIRHFETTLGDDEKKVILSFLDRFSLCKVNCVSKQFSLSLLSNDDLFWKDYFIKFINRFFKTNYISQFYNGMSEEEIKMEKNKVIELTKCNYKMELIKQIKKLFKKAENIPKERLSKIFYEPNTFLVKKEMTLENQSNILQKSKELAESIKTVIIGNESVGKNCLMFVLSGQSDSIKHESYISTVDNIGKSVEIGNKSYSLHLWGIKGQEQYERLRPLSYPGTDIFILCFSIVDLDSFDQVSNWARELNFYCPDTPIVLCGTKVDLRDNNFQLLLKSGIVPVSKEEGVAKAKEIEAIAYVEVSAMNGGGEFKDLDKFILLLSYLTKSYSQKEIQELCEKFGKAKCLIQ
ncbi:hypothetical protein ABK040_005546 [Willaertia magna]